MRLKHPTRPETCGTCNGEGRVLPEHTTIPTDPDGKLICPECRGRRIIDRSLSIPERLLKIEERLGLPTEYPQA